MFLAPLKTSNTISQKECYICQMWGSVGPTPNPSQEGNGGRG